MQVHLINHIQLTFGYICMTTRFNIYIYIYIERERERERENMLVIIV